MKRRLSHLVSITLLLIFVISGLASAVLPILGPITATKSVSAAGTGTEYAFYYPNTAEFKGNIKAAFRDDPKINKDSTVNLLKQTKLIVRNADSGLGTLILSLDTRSTKENDLPEYKADYYCTPTQGTTLEKSVTTPDGTRPYVRYTYGVALDDNHAWGGITEDAKDTTYVGVLGGSSAGNVGDVTFPTVVNTNTGNLAKKTFKIPGKDGDFDIRQKIETNTTKDNYYGKEDNTDKYTFQNATDIDGNPIPGAASIVGDTVAVLGACMPHPKGYMDNAHKAMNYWQLNAADQAVWDQAVKDASLGDNVETAATAADASTTADDNPGLDCKVKAFNPLTWLVCPAVKGMINIVGDLDDLINSLMTVGTPGQSDNPSQIFCEASPSAADKATCASYHTAWSSFRNISLGLIAVVGLIVVTSQALGFEILDAYMIRKMLPRILIAAVAVTLSWQLMRFFVTLTNDLGFGVRYLIYHPFTSLPNANATLGGGGVFATSLIAGGAIAALGIFGVLTFAATAALAVFIAFIVLIIRQMLIIILIVMAPVAIVAYVLPNTQKVYKLWWDSFSKALFMFPIVSAMIASGRVFALVAGSSPDSTTGQMIGFATFIPNHALSYFGAGSSIGQLIGFAAYFAPYFLMPMAFRFAGGALAGIGGFVNNRGKGGFDRLKQYRSGQMQQNFKKMGTGDRWQGNNLAARTFNRTTAGVGLGYKGRFGVGERGRGALDLKRRGAAAEAVKSNPALQQLGYDDNAIAVMALSGGTSTGARRAAAALGLNEEQTRRAVGTANSVGFNDTNAAAALDLMAQNKSRALRDGIVMPDGSVRDLSGDAGMALVQESASRISKGNPQLAQNMVGSFAFHSRNAGRLDLGGESPTAVGAAGGGGSTMAGWNRSSPSQHAQAFGASTANYMKQATNILRDEDADGNHHVYSAGDKRAAVIALSEMHAALPGATEGNQRSINDAMHNVGIDHNSGLSVERQLANIASGRAADDRTISDRGNVMGTVATGIHPVTGATLTGIGDTGVAAPAGTNVITANEINGLARKYGQNVPDDARGAAPPGGGTPPAGATTP